MPKGGIRNITCTINNPTEELLEMLNLAYDEGFIKYIIGGLERGEKTGTPHLQTYIQLAKQHRKSAIDKRLKGIWAEESKGSARENILYACKGEMLKKEWNRRGPDGKKLKEKGLDYGKNTQILINIGEPKEQGKRVDLNNIQEALMNGIPLHEIVWKCENYQQIRYAEKLYESPYVPKPHRTWRTECFVYWGEEGNVGKSYKAREEAEKYAALNNYRVWYSGENMMWFSEYNGQEVVVLEEWDDSQCTLGLLNRLLDDTPMRVNPKCEPQCEWLAKRVYISTNFNPQDWYINCKQSRRETLIGDEDGEGGRITESRHFFIKRKEGRPKTRICDQTDPYDTDNMVSQDSNSISEDSEEASQKSAGNIDPPPLSDLLENLKVPKMEEINWKEKLKNFLGPRSPKNSEKNKINIPENQDIHPIIKKKIEEKNICKECPTQLKWGKDSVKYNPLCDNCKSKPRCHGLFGRNENEGCKNIPEIQRRRHDLLGNEIIDYWPKCSKCDFEDAR